MTSLDYSKLKPGKKMDDDDEGGMTSNWNGMLSNNHKQTATTSNSSFKQGCCPSSTGAWFGWGLRNNAEKCLFT